MIVAKKTYTYEKFFSKSIEFLDALKLVVYIQSFCNKPKIGFIREKFYTNLVDLHDQEQIFKDFKSNTRNEIRKAIKDKNTIEIEDNEESFVDYYNDFALSKSLNTISLPDLKRFGQNLVITKVKNNEEVIVMHSYIIDNQIKRVRLLHSATSVTNNNRSFIGRANRFLHYKDMIYFMEKGILQYDLGGYAFNTKIKSLENINKFKDSFGGTLVENCNYYPILYLFASKIKKLFKW